ncbi:hypothetical protein OG874_37635 [Nocardia sp. NBC_00565]|uniref:hypothetical protein n=1 Tax=Nocardia sp. NBC_00565 TaxID=2975993 RepID=UPI002E8113B6|nr:hypothetical protein [Nocardia sp. NBC_00565]WUC02389.1 hypothetical protein OG874_37635 [Nocardia sp. NBC_00565]
MTEFELEGEVEELVIPLSEMGGNEPDLPGASGSRARIYNDYPLAITFIRKSGGSYRHMLTLGPGSTTSDEFWSDDELFIVTNTGFKYLMEFRSGGRDWTFYTQRSARLAAGTNNVSRLFGISSSATDGAEQASDGARGR